MLPLLKMMTITQGKKRLVWIETPALKKRYAVYLAEQQGRKDYSSYIRYVIIFHSAPGAHGAHSKAWHGQPSALAEPARVFHLQQAQLTLKSCCKSWLGCPCSFDLFCKGKILCLQTGPQVSMSSEDTGLCKTIGSVWLNSVRFACGWRQNALLWLSAESPIMLSR